MSPDKSRQYAGRPVAERGDERRRRFLDSALDVFSRRGYSSSTVVDICREAGLSTRQFYQCFVDKEAVLSTLYDEANARVQKAVLSSFAAGSEGFSGSLRTAVRAYVDALTADPRVTHLVVTSVVGVSDEFEEKRDRQRQQWLDGLNGFAEAAMVNGDLARRDYTLAWIALVGAINALAAAFIRAQPSPASLEELLDQVDALLWDGLLG